MYLDIDVGNTRAKWRLSGIRDHHGAVSSDVGEIIAQVIELRNQIKRLNGLRVATVKGDTWERALQQACKQNGLSLQLIRVGREALGLRNQYPDVSRLGVDRWCAMVAAWHRMQRDFPQSQLACVVDAGTAMTVDVIVGQKDGSALHKGGYIVPGIAMQVDALQGGTGRIALDASRLPPSTDLGTQTNKAVLNGVIASAVALIKETIAREERMLQSQAAFWLCGGDADTLRPFLTAQSPMDAKELVLEGIALLAG